MENVRWIRVMTDCFGVWIITPWSNQDGMKAFETIRPTQMDCDPCTRFETIQLTSYRLQYASVELSKQLVWLLMMSEVKTVLHARKTWRWVDTEPSRVRDQIRTYRQLRTGSLEALDRQKSRSEPQLAKPACLDLPFFCGDDWWVVKGIRRATRAPTMQGRSWARASKHWSLAAAAADRLAAMCGQQHQPPGTCLLRFWNNHHSPSKIASSGG